MNLIFVTNARFSKTENGNIYGYHTSINYNTFEHYLEVFDKVMIIARVEQVFNKNFEESIRVNKGNVEVVSVPYFIGPMQYLGKFFKIKKAIRKYLNNDAAIICRIPGTLGRLTAYEAKMIKKPFGVEVAADPYDVFAPGSFTHPLRRFLRYWGSFQLKKNLINSSAALYVTAQKLQRRYPVKQGIFQTYASNVILQEESFAKSHKKWSIKKVYTVISMGTLDQMYKAPDILIKAIQKVNDSNNGKKIKLLWLGGGKFKGDMQNLAKTLKIANEVSFLGVVKPPEKVRYYLDSADLFILPSRTEGLPRAMVEAMARGLPCVGTKIGGIPELLSEAALVPINNVNKLANRLEEILYNEELFNKLAEENLNKSREFSYHILNQRRFKFYKKVKELTAIFNDNKL